jgi:hypothetical protein
MIMKNLSIGTQSFEQLRERDLLYVDKTRDIYRLVNNNRIVFLSRPRRFGKSMLVSTLDALFSGRKELFEGLWIHDRWDWTRLHPVIKIDWTLIAHSTPEEMEAGIISYLGRFADKYQFDLTSKSAPGCFFELIEKLHQKTGREVVILVDEYDKPVTGHLFDSHLTTFKTAIHDFYQVMKGADEHIRFIFLTGVSKFSGLSIFSALNNLNDITIDDKYASICGYTQEELESNFPEYIDELAAHFGWEREKLLAAIRHWYDGYSWDGKTSVYNPFSTLVLFDKKRFGDYWFHTGTPTFLIEILQQRERASIVLEPISIDDSLLDGYGPETLDEIPLFFQTGYLTIKNVTSTENGTRYTLDVPNKEVKDALLQRLLLAYGNYAPERVDKLRQTVEQCLRDGDERGLAACLETVVATVPNELKMNREAHYHALILIWLRFLGFDVHPEASNNLGRADAVWKQPGVTVVAELKYRKDQDTKSLLDAAMRQIHERRYFNQAIGRVLLLGIAFSGAEIACRMEMLDR